MASVENWISLFEDRARSREYLKDDYGDKYHKFEGKRELLLSLLKLHKEKFSNEEIIIVRAPGRINLMGRHIDHQGGDVNLIAIDQEIFITAALRKDSKILAYNIDGNSFKKFQLDFSSLNSRVLKDWQELLNSEDILLEYRSPGGDWYNYIKAAYLRIANRCNNEKIWGANLCVSGNIMIAAGLSSSTALTTGILHALLELNNIQLSDDELINLCAEAEWFVGTRGGSADQIALKLARKNKIVHIKQFPLQGDWIEFPKNCEILIFNSLIIADKSGSKKDIFNERVLAYEVGFNLIKMRFPQLTTKLLYLRDFSPDNLNMESAELIKLLSKLPEYVNFNEIPKILGNMWDEIKKYYSFNEIPQQIPIRKVIVYGISECERSKLFYEFLTIGDIKSAGRLMNISHKGDRVVVFNENFKSSLYENEVDDTKLENYIDVAIRLDQISGGYGCSIPEIDFVIDLVKNYNGVFGAQLSGAGMGGCAMILVEKKKRDSIKKLINDNYMRHFKKRCVIYTCQPVNGLSIYTSP
jgi:galactokinase